MFNWSTFFSSILVVLFRDTPLGYLHCTQVESQIAKDSQIWLFLTILAIWLSAYTKQRQPNGVSLKRTTKMLPKNVDQLSIGHSRLIFTTYYKFGKIFPCNLLNVAKKKLHTLSNGPTSIPKTFLSSVKETEPESNRYLDLPDTLHILSHSIQQSWP